MIQLTYLTLFPELIENYFQEGLLSRALSHQLVSKKTIQLRDFSKNSYKSVDGKSYGGGDGMVFSPEPIVAAIDSVKKNFAVGSKNKVVMLSPQGKVCSHEMLQELAEQDHIVFLCGRYAGFDQRISTHCDLEISLGDYVLSGGELPALVLTEGLMRHRPGFLGNAQSLNKDSFATSLKLLEAPQFTEPVQFQNEIVPEVLLSGHHQKIADWKKQMAFLVTLKKRPELINQQKKQFSVKEISDYIKFYQTLSSADKKTLGVENLESELSLL